MNSIDFSTLPLKPELISNLSTLGYTEMTDVQAQSLPLVLEGHDVIAQAKTGSGKTAAFALGLLNSLDIKAFHIQSLVLCPTRELADQVAKEIRKLARSIHNIKVLSLCGGMPFGPQLGSLEHGAHIIVGTPGRIEEHVRKNTLALDRVKMLVLDEADRMLDMGFQESIDAIIAATPAQRQTLLFSATFPDEIQSIASRIMRQATRVTVESQHDQSSIEQYFFPIGEFSRFDALRSLLLHYRPESTVIFCNTKIETQALADQLKQYNFSATALHGDLEQKQREQRLVRFSNRSVSLLVATDVAARGLDISELDAVINYNLARDLQVHVHRVGRTGRAGNEGLACTLYNEKESFKLQQLEKYLDQKLNIKPLPEGIQLDSKPFWPPMSCLQIEGGKKQKVRAGDILGALTASKQIIGKQVGKIQIFDNCAYVAVIQDQAKLALEILNTAPIKGRNFRSRILHD